MIIGHTTIFIEMYQYFSQKITYYVIRLNLVNFWMFYKKISNIKKSQCSENGIKLKAAESNKTLRFYSFVLAFA